MIRPFNFCQNTEYLSAMNISASNARFITFEGVEGVGKSTQINLLAERLAETGIDSVRTREPGGTTGAEIIRLLLLDGAAEELGPDAEAMLFAAARADHVDQVIRPALITGKWVLCDRFSDSTRIYQGEGGVEPELIEELETIALREVVPDVTIIIDMPAAIGLKRTQERRNADAANVRDRFEREELVVHEKRRRAFLKLADSDPARYVVVNGLEGIDNVADQIWNGLSNLVDSR